MAYRRCTEGSQTRAHPIPSSVMDTLIANMAAMRPSAVSLCQSVTAISFSILLCYHKKAERGVSVRLHSKVWTRKWTAGDDLKLQWLPSHLLCGLESETGCPDLWTAWVQRVCETKNIYIFIQQLYYMWSCWLSARFSSSILNLDYCILYPLGSLVFSRNLTIGGWL